MIITIHRRKKGQEPYRIPCPDTLGESINQFGNDLVFELFREGYTQRAMDAMKKGTYSESWIPRQKTKRRVAQALKVTQESLANMSPEELKEYLKGLAEIAKQQIQPAG